MQMNDDFSTLNCFVSSLCWLHKYWRRSIFIYCNFVIVLHTKKKKGKEGRKGLETLSLCVDKLFHLVNPLIAGAARRGFVRKCLICFPPPPPPKNNCRQPPRLSIIRIFVRGGLHSSLLTLTNYLTKWKSPSLHVPQPPPFNYRAYRRKWKHRWVLPEWTHNLYALVKISLGSMTALSTAFIAPCSPKLRFYVDVRVTVAVKQHRKTNRRRAPSAR